MANLLSILQRNIDKLIPGGYSAGRERVRKSFATPEGRRGYFLPTATPLFKDYISQTARSIPTGIGSALKLSPPYQAYRGLTAKPYTPSELGGDVSSLMQPLYRLLNPYAPIYGTGLSMIKSARQGRTSPEQLLEAGERGLLRQPGIGETLTDNPTVAGVIDIAFMTGMVGRSFIKKKLNSLNLKAKEINAVSNTLGIKPTDSLKNINRVWKSKVTKYPEAFAGRGSASELSRVKELNNAYNLLKNAGVVDKRYAVAFDFVVNKLPKMPLGLSIKAKPREVKAPVTPTIKTKALIKAGEGKTPFTGLMTETPTATKVRRELGLTPKDVYQKAPSAVDYSIRGKEHLVKRTPLSKNVENMTDISSYSKGSQTVYRNFKTVYGDKYPIVKEVMLDPLDVSKGQYINMQKNWTGELKKSVVDKYGFKRGSKESAAIQKYGEGIQTESSLIEEFGKVKARNIIEADKWFRGAYDNLIEQVNKSRKIIYPNNPDMIIPKRKDYYRHFKELSGVQGLVNIFESQAAIDPMLAGISGFTTPKTKWLSFAQKRMRMGETDYDAVGGFLDYLPKAAYATNIDLHINKFRNLGKELAVTTSEGGDVGAYGKLNNFVEFLEDYANDLSGKTNPLDRGIQKYAGRKTFKVINWINSRVKANVILGNLSSSLAQFFNVPQGIASAGEKNFVTGMYNATLNLFKDVKPMDKSIFLNERYSGNIYSQFDNKILQKPKKFAIWLTQILDEVGTKFIWEAHYKKAVTENIPNPIKYSDDMAREMVAGRGVGEVPLIQKSKLVQIIAPFQVEVENAWNVMGGWVKNKEFLTLIKFFIWSYVFNSVAEEIRGSRVTFDPIDAVMNALEIYKEEDDKGKGLLKGIGRLGGELLSNRMFGQSAAALYPESGATIAGIQTPPRTELFGEGDPTKYGTGLLSVKALQDPLYKLLFPYGGVQAKKTIEGQKAIQEGGVYTRTGKLKYPVSSELPAALQTLLFGKSSTPEAEEYYSEDQRPLGEKQTKIFQLLRTLMPEKAEQYQEGIISKREGVTKAKEMIKAKLINTEVYKMADKETRKKLIDKVYSIMVR